MRTIPYFRDRSSKSLILAYFSLVAFMFSVACGLAREGSTLSVDVGVFAKENNREKGRGPLLVRIMIKNSTNLAICLPSFYFQTVGAPNNELFSIFDETNKPLNYIGTIAEPDRPMTAYNIVPPGEHFVSEVDLSEVYKFHNEMHLYHFQYAYYVPFCDQFNKSYPENGLTPLYYNSLLVSGNFKKLVRPRFKGVYLLSGVTSFEY